MAPTMTSPPPTAAEPKPSPAFWNVPNSLSLARLVLAAAVFALIAYGYYLSAMVVFTLAALSDILDGYFARLLNQVSPIGRQLDPLVDKVIVLGAMVYLVPIPGTGLAPWMVVVIVARELFVQALRSLIEGRGIAFGARGAGKLKTFFQCLAVIGILLVLGLADQAPTALLWARDLTTWTAVALTIYSGAVYFVVAWPALKKEGF